jgi:FMN phosphatase YigB (HAD superfamily)
VTESPPEAVVFDLDDTLYDCWAQCVLPAHREAAAAMRRAGLRAEEREIYERRLAYAGIEEDLDAVVSRSFPCADPTAAAEAGRRAFYVRDPGVLVPHPFTHAVLRACRAVVETVLITTGHPDTQRTKIERLRLADAFDEILLDDVFSRSSKRALLEEWLRRTGRAPETVLVVGDRPSSEIRAALDLGCRPLRVRAGEFAVVPTPVGVPEAHDVRAVLPLLPSRPRPGPSV